MKKMTSAFVAVLACFRFAGIAQAQSTQPADVKWSTTNPASPIAQGATLQHLSGGFLFTEGCTSDEKGNVFFVDQPNDRIMEWSTDGKLTTWLQPSGRANGMSFDAKGNLVACADEKSQLWSIAPDKMVSVVVKDFGGKYLNGPNDVWIRPDGGMYLTDPFYRRDWWKERGMEAQQGVQAVYFLDADRKTFKRVIEDFRQPNGIIGTPDGHTLYVSDIRAGKTYSYTIQPDGALADKKLFCEYGSDGMTIDSEGNVYTTGRDIVGIFNRDGVLLDKIPVRGSANVCFGGADGKTLFITARTEIFGLQMRTHRVGPQ